jgi:hypothetical protein
MCVLVARVEGYRGVWMSENKSGSCAWFECYAVLVLGWLDMDDDAAAEADQRVWGLGHMQLLSSLSHASCFLIHPVDSQHVTSRSFSREVLDRKVMILCFAHSMPCCATI